MDPLRCHHCGFVTSGTQAKNPSDPLNATPGTRHHMLLNCNEAPQDSDICAIESMNSKADAQVALLDDESTRLQERLRELDAQRVALSNYQAQNRTILSPLRRMPPEILGQIFSCTLAPVMDATERERYHPTDSPWVLTHVSHLWRAVAISNPLLWSLVTISYQPQLDPSTSYPLSMVETQMARCPTLKIHFYGCETTDPGPQIEMFRLLAKDASRWEELSVGLTSALVPLLDGLRGRVPQRRRLWIQWESAASQTAAHSIDCFERAPSLVDVGVYNEYRVVPLVFPVRQLTSYQLDAPWDTHWRILQAAPKLVQARINIKSNKEPWPAPLQILEFASLERLHVSRLEVLDYIRAPALTYLSISLVGSRHASFAAQAQAARNFQAFTSGSSALRKLCVASGDVSTIVKFLKTIPSLTELRLIVTAFGFEPMMRALTVSETARSRDVAPHLSSISVGSDLGACFDWGKGILPQQCRSGSLRQSDSAAHVEPDSDARL
ncbi:hypothetical protein DFH06DRAFT_123802 [Mycena polygramma]|nr:hypothetical protein DFH06DRAFT_123802 [Mycena polygramma]